MELLEYQAKELFRMVGIPILPSQTIEDSRQIKQLQIPYPVVLKSQVRSGGRGKAGGVRFVANTIDAIAAARTIFKLSILGEYPEVILAEAHYNAEREFFLAVVLDYNLQCPVLLGSALGGMNVESLLANLQQVVIESDFSLFHARRLAAKMGLSGKLICSVSEIIAKMYRLFESKDLDLVEINPLGVNTQGELMALDGKITINDRAFARQPVIKSLNFSEYQKQANLHHFLSLERDYPQVEWRWLNWQNKTGKIALICNSFDLALLNWDLLHEEKVNLACGALIENKAQDKLDDFQSYQEQILKILGELESIKSIKAVLIDIYETEEVSKKIIETVRDYCQSQIESALSPKEGQLVAKNSVPSTPKASTKAHKSRRSSVESVTQPQFILRLPGTNNLDHLCPEEKIYLSSNLKAAIAQAVAVVQSS